MRKRSSRIIVSRQLRLGDIPALLDLEHKQWTPEQAATAADFRERMRAHPELCNGAFDRDTGELLASLFCKPTAESEWVRPNDWKTCAALGASTHVGCQASALFGISLTSVEPRAAMQLIAYQFLHALRSGKRHAYLGSPMPGLSRHLSRHPGACAEKYARAVKSGVPLDPQLRYYHAKGFKEIVAVRAGYFPHVASLDHGAILRARVPGQWLRPVLRVLPTRALLTVAAAVPRWVIPDDASGEAHPRPA